MKKRTKVILAVAVIVVLAAAAIVVAQARKPKGTAVDLAEVQRSNLTRKVAANGKIEAQRKVDLSADVMGQIVNLGVREGDVVERGDFLLQIDRTQLAASTAGAEASLRALFADRDAARAATADAQRTHDRALRNFQEQIISQAELDRARTELDAARAREQAIEGRIEQARATLSGARDTLSKTTIRAPMSGIVTALPVEEGEVAVIGTMNNPGTVLLTISDMSVVEAVMEVDETDIPTVVVGQAAKVTIDAYPNQTFDGTVTSVGSSPMQTFGGATGSEAVNFEVKIQLANPPPTIRPGFSASAEIFTGSRENAVAIPLQALVVREQPREGAAAAPPVEEEGVYVFEDGKVTFVRVETGLTGDTMIEIVGGLEPGQQIVTGPFRALREIEDGDTVRRAEAPKESRR